MCAPTTMNWTGGIWIGEPAAGCGNYDIADLLVPHGTRGPARGRRQPAIGAPRIWVHMWLEAYRISRGAGPPALYQPPDDEL